MKVKLELDVKSLERHGSERIPTAAELTEAIRDQFGTAVRDGVEGRYWKIPKPDYFVFADLVKVEVQ